MSNGKQQLKVFLCHSSSDKVAVRKLYHQLIEDEFDVWLDEEKLLPGQDWDFEIRKAVRSSDVVVVCLSNNSITKEGYVQKEIRIALDVADEKPDGTIFIIPAKFENCSVPERISKWQWVDLYIADGYKKLTLSLDSRLGSLVGSIASVKKPKTKKEKNVISKTDDFEEKEDSTPHVIITNKYLDKLKKIVTLRAPNKGKPSNVSFSPDNKLIAVEYSFDIDLESLLSIDNNSLLGMVVVYDIRTQNMICVRDDMDGELVFSGTDKLITANINGVELLEISKKSKTRLSEVSDMRVAFSFDGKTIALGGLDGTIRIYDLMSGRKLNSFRRDLDLADHLMMKINNKEPRLEITKLCFSPVGNLLAASDEQYISLWDIRNNECYKLRAWEYDSAFAFSPEKDLFALCNDNQVSFITINEAKKFYEETKKENILSNEWMYQSCVKLRSSENQTSIVFSPDGKLLVIGTENGSIKFVDMDRKILLKSIKTHKSSITDVSFSPNGLLLASACEDGSISIWGIP